MEQRQVQEARPVLRLGGDPPAAPARGVVEAAGQPSGPSTTAIRSGLRRCSSRSRSPTVTRLDIGIAGQEQMAVERLDEIGARLARIRLAEEILRATLHRYLEML